MQTEKLTGPLLDYWAATAFGLVPDPGFALMMACGQEEPVFGVQRAQADGSTFIDDFNPSSDASDANVIFKVHPVTIIPNTNPFGPNSFMACMDNQVGQKKVGAGWFLGRTEIEAGLRAFVAARFGHEVPDLADLA